MEDYLHECLEFLQRAGDDFGRRRKEVRDSRVWSLLPLEWKALAFLAATKAAPEAIGIEVPSGPSGATSRRRPRLGRRGGRGKIRSMEDRLATPAEALCSSEPPAYKLAVLAAQKQRMGASWDSSWDGEMVSLRSECEQGIHPVWERLAREAPLLAEMGRFPVVEPEVVVVDSTDWVQAARFDPLDHNELKMWLSLDLPFKTSSEQASVLQSIKRDLSGGRVRPNRWLSSMLPSLRGLREEGALLEGILLASASSDEALGVFDVLEGGALGELSGRHSMLIRIRSGDLSDWEACAKRSGDGSLSRALRVAAWRRVEDSGAELSVQDLLAGSAVLAEVGEVIPEALKWSLASSLVSEGKASEALQHIEKLGIEGSLQVSTALDILATVDSEALGDSVTEAVTTMDGDGALLVMRHDGVPIRIRLQAARRLSGMDSIRHTDEILNMFTSAADIGGLVGVLKEDPSLARAYPHRVLLAWHLISGKDAIGSKDDLSALRKSALMSIEGSVDDGILSDASIALISLLDGIPQDIESVHKKLDSDGLRALNEVRRALSPEGDGVVREARIEDLRHSIEIAELTRLESRLFDALIDALLLNRAAMDLQSGVGEREESAAESLGRLCGRKDSSMRIIGGATNLVIEHNVGVGPLEKWYSNHDRSGAEFQIVRAAILRGNDDRMNAARAYKDAAMKLRLDFERSALILRKSLIEFAHAAGWREAVALIDGHPVLSSSVTNRFKLYLRICRDHEEGKKEAASSRLIEFAAREEERTRNGAGNGVKARRLEALETLQRYPDEHGLPMDPFQGRVRAALQELRSSETSRQSDLERRFLIEMRGEKDTREITLICMEVTEDDPLRGLWMLEKAIESGSLNAKQKNTLKRTQRALFGSHSGTIPVKDRRTLRNLSLRPLILVDTNILIGALKDDLLMEISVDSLGSLDWTVERAFHWMLRRRRGEGRVHLHIPPAAKGEFLHRAKSPDSVLGLFDDVYIDKGMWGEKITAEFLEERVQAICTAFGDWQHSGSEGNKTDVGLDEFLVRHREVFQLVDEQKRRGGKAPQRTSIGGEEIYPERGDRDIMCDAALLASTSINDVGSILVATRDSDFRLVSRALEEEYGFGVVGDAQQLNSRVL